MTPRRAPFRLLLAALLCLQSSLAAAHCLLARGAHHAFPVEICTAEGKLLLDLGGPVEKEGAAEAGGCLACHALAQLVLPGPAVLAAPAGALPLRLMPSAEAGLPPGARAPPYASRAPPTRS
jgi:hypothetical protein